jgi:bacterial/archaeal transporter family-2 protein
MGTAPLVPLGATFLVGGLTAIQSRINGQLSATLGNSLEAAVISFASGLVILGVIVAMVPAVRRGVARIPEAIGNGELAWWQVLGGILGGAFVAVQAAVVPLVGVAVFTVAVVAGQSSNSLLVDRAGLGPAGRQAITPRRVVAAVLAVLAVALAVANRFIDGDVSVVAVVLAFLAGVIIAVQQAINGRVARASRNPMSATVVNFIFGTVALSAALGIVGGFAGQGVAPLPGGPPWIYLGGVIGIVFIAIASWVVPIVGVLLFALLSIAGQLSGALLLDVVAPTAGTELVWNLFAGVALALVAVVVAARGRGTAPPAMRDSAP